MSLDLGYGACVGGAKTLKLLHFKSFFHWSSLAVSDA